MTPADHQLCLCQLATRLSAEGATEQAAAVEAALLAIDENRRLKVALVEAIQAGRDAIERTHSRAALKEEQTP